MNDKQTKRIAALLGLLAVISLGCNSEDPVVGRSVDDPTMEDPSDDPAMEDPTDDPTMDPDDPTMDPDDPTMDPDDPTMDPDDPRDPTGSVSFARPEGPTAYTNGTLVVEIDPQGEAENFELVVDDTETLHAFTESNLYNWDTSALAEGNYELAIRFTLGETPRWSFDNKEVIVDRTAPQVLRQTPLDGDNFTTKDVPIELTFDEPLDANTVTPVSVTLAFDNGQSTTVTPTLSSDGTQLTIDFDRDSIETPYTATLLLNGVTDLAGNSVRADLSYSVEAWRSEMISGRMTNFEYAELNGTEYLFGVVQGNTDDLVRVFKRGAGWTEVASEPMNQIYDIDLDVADDKAHVAVLHRGFGGGLIVKRASILEFDPNSDSFSQAGSQAVGVDSNSGAIAIDVRAAALGTIDAVAAISDGDLRVFETVNRNLTDQTINSFPTVEYEFVRDENLEVAVTSDGTPEVIFMRCLTDSDPCFQTIGERVQKGRSSWNDIGLLGTYASNQCDEFDSFEAGWHNDAPFLLLSQYGPCGSADPVVRAVEGDNAGWSDITTDIMSSMPNLNATAYSSHLGLGPNGEIYALLSSGDHMVLGTIDANGVAWMPEIGADLQTGLLAQFRSERVFVQESGAPVVVFTHQMNTRIYRRN